jgi:hypothetical protein
VFITSRLAVLLGYVNNGDWLRFGVGSIICTIIVYFGCYVVGVSVIRENVLIRMILR